MRGKADEYPRKCIDLDLDKGRCRAYSAAAGTAYAYQPLTTRCGAPTTAVGTFYGSDPEMPRLSLCIGLGIPVLVVHCDLAAAGIRLQCFIAT